MAKQQRRQTQQPTSSRSMLVMLAAGGLVVAALVVWALTRTVESPAPVAVTTSEPVPISPSSSPLTATQTPPVSPALQSPEPTTAAVPRIAVEDLREKMRAGSVTVIDVRPAAAYQTAHIAGAMNIPMASIEGEMSSLPKNKPIVTYCT